MKTEQRKNELFLVKFGLMADELHEVNSKGAMMEAELASVKSNVGVIKKLETHLKDYEAKVRCEVVSEV